ncbi:MAG: GYDIA family GHMP kinase [Hyphomicrobiales bacterium]
MERMKFYGHGKLMLTGEYLVLFGASAIALPTKLGQEFEYTPKANGILSWNGTTVKGKWINAKFNPADLSIIDDKSDATEKLHHLLLSVRKLNPNFLIEGGKVSSYLEFSPEWGLGSSASLIAFLSQLGNVDPYELLNISTDGSGYDIACSMSDSPIYYKIKSSGRPEYYPLVYRPAFKDNLYFVYSGKKQTTHSEIKRFRKMWTVDYSLIQNITEISENIVHCNNQKHFNELLTQHEDAISNVLNLPSIQKAEFNDFHGTVKSLGAWGGDFLLFSSLMERKDTIAYLHNKGFNVIKPYDDIIL